MPFPIPPKEGLHEQTPRLCTEGVINAVRAPERAAAAEASQPAWPPPMTMTSYGLVLCQRGCKGGLRGDILFGVGDGSECPARAVTIHGSDARRMAPELARPLGYETLHRES